MLINSCCLCRSVPYCVDHEHILVNNSESNQYRASRGDEGDFRQPGHRTSRACSKAKGRIGRNWRKSDSSVHLARQPQPVHSLGARVSPSVCPAEGDQGDPEGRDGSN